MTTIAQQAEVLCELEYARIAPPSKYIAGFSTRLGRELALHRTQQAIYCWSQDVPLAGAPTSPIRQYEAHEPRNSNLNGKNCPTLQIGRKVHYWKFEDTASFQNFLHWYGQVS
ncbi:hypothetical protein [Pseudomonas grandcourensis]|uniref:hypothetical protein n=1 Tax=Pseudomonas grandcourensis TaxID=3136736 RepID=UPI0032663385